MNRDTIVKTVADGIIEKDVDLLNSLSVSDEVMEVMAAEHAARSEALAKLIEPTMGRSLLLMLSRALLSAAKQIEDATVPVAELIHV